MSCVQFITESTWLTHARLNLNCKFNLSPSLEFSLIQFNWMHPEALDCKMQFHHVIWLRSVGVHQQLSNILTMAWLWGAPKGWFSSFPSTTTYTTILMTFTASVYTHPVKRVCTSLWGCIAFLLHQDFPLRGHLSEKGEAWKKQWVAYVELSACQEREWRDEKRWEQPEESMSSFLSYASLSMTAFAQGRRIRSC